MLKIVFAGTPIFTLPVLDLLAKEFSLVGILTAPPRRQGRKMKVYFSDVFVYSDLLKKNNVVPLDLPVFTAEKIDDELVSSLAKLKPDLLVCFAYGRIFPKKLMDVFTFGGINLHPSLLPRWRGPSPIPFAILSGEKETGVSIQTIKEKLDSGNILIQERFEICPGETTETVLSAKVAPLSARLLSKVLLRFDEYAKNAKAQQEEEATYSRLLTKEDGYIDWKKRAIEIERQILAFTPWPRTYTFCDGKKLNIVDAVAIKDTCDNFCEQKEAECGSVLGSKNDLGILVRTGDGLLCVRELQWQTKKVLKWKDFLNGTPGFVGSLLS